MMTDYDKSWLSEKHPTLIPSSNGVSGKIELIATYNDKSNQFLILDKGIPDTVGGLRLTGNFLIHIQERKDNSFSKLPAVYVVGVETISDRHFSQNDKSACLCSPLEEDEFLTPYFQFKLFLEQLVVPFLYGQQYYSINKRWPWPEYAHGATGLLEAYSKVADPSKAQDCLHKLQHDRAAWPKIKVALTQKTFIKGHTHCFCIKRNHIRRCHPDALKGFQMLRQDIKMHGITIS